jgi:uncharacterized repeat protein (TIGR01451 family)
LSWCLLPVAVLPLIALTAKAQGPYFPPAVAPPLPIPLLYVRVAGPEGMVVTFYRGELAGQTVTAPATVGLRPGYIYQVKLSGMTAYPLQSFYPTLEVRGSLRGDAHLCPADYPVTLNFTDEDFKAVARESLVTKAVVLERPALALPLPTQADRPLEIQVAPGRDPVCEAVEHGRVLLIVRLGQREWSEGELAARGVPGTVLLPGEKALPEPPAPPCLPWASFLLLYDPIHGPEPASLEMCIPDGGDSGLPAGYDAEGRLRGLDPSDTIAEYTDSHGRMRITCSNRVCVCVPRYLVLRGEIRPALEQVVRAPGAAAVLQGGVLLESLQVPVQQEQLEYPAAMAGRQRPSATVELVAPEIFGQVEGLDVIGLVRTPANVTAACVPPEHVPEKPLLLIKFPDKCCALVGDVVTFTLRYSNYGGRPITNVVVSDSLAARYDLIQGSARTDRAATFTTQPNEAGSLILRWQINDPLPPGESGTVTFQVRVR